MSDYQRCPTCREFAWFGEKSVRFGRHICSPLWEARIRETKWENGWTDVYARDVEDAASKFCQLYDSDGDYTIIQNGEAEVEVRRFGDDKISLVEITAESVPTYYARERSPAISSAERNADESA